MTTEKHQSKYICGERINRRGIGRVAGVLGVLINEVIAKLKHMVGNPFYDIASKVLSEGLSGFQGELSLGPRRAAGGFFAITSILLIFLYSPVLSMEKDQRLWKYSPVKDWLDDDLSFIYHRDRASSFTVVRIFIKGGRRAEPEGLKGLAYLTSRICTQFPEYRDVQHLSILGSSIYSTAEDDYTVITITALSEYTDTTLDLVVDFIRKPLISGKRLKQLREGMAHIRKEEADEPDAWVKVKYADIFYPGTAYSSSSYGDAASMKRIKAKHVKKFYKDHVRLSNMVIAVSTDMPLLQVRKMIKRHFGGFSRKWEKKVMVPVKKVAVPEKKVHFCYADKTQSLVSLGLLLPETTLYNYTCAELLETVLGQGMGSRLWPLRSEEKLAYTVGALVVHMREGSILRASLKTDHSKKTRALEKLRTILVALYEKGVSGEEFEEAVRLSRVYFLQDIETRRNRVFLLGAFESMGIGFRGLEGYYNKLGEITLEEFNEYIKKVLKPERLVAV
ncbi:MAG: insulinase family protein, partial [bacterium]|nr:insulinase family protein [bacterium]